MATASFGIFSILMALLSGGANNLLDFVQTDAYWKAKNVTVTVDQLLADLKDPAAVDVSASIKALGSGTFEQREAAAAKIVAAGPAALPLLEKSTDDADVEVANRVRGLIQQIKLNSKANSVRRLMAIRTLGEQKSPQALAALKPLLTSKEPFVADYAARAVATIEGKPLAAPDDKDALKQDIALLPANVGVVGQLKLSGAKKLTINDVLKTLPAAQPGEDRAQTLAMMNQQIIALADQIGDVRIDSITFAVSDTVNPNAGFTTAVVRGLYDAQAVSVFMSKNNLNAQIVDGVAVYSPDNEVAILMPSDERIILMNGASKETLPVKEFIAATKANKGAIATNADISKLLATVDPAAKFWAVCKVTDSYRQAQVIKAFDTLTLTARQEGETTNITLAGAGSSEAEVKDAVNSINSGLETARKQLHDVLEFMPAMKPVADLAAAAKCENNGKTATLTSAIKGDPAALIGAFFMSSMGVHTEPAQAAPAAAQPGKPETIKGKDEPEK